MTTETNITATPNNLIIHPSFIRVNGADGRAIARANKMQNGEWSVKGGECEPYVTMPYAAAVKVMEAAALRVMFS